MRTEAKRLRGDVLDAAGCGFWILAGRFRGDDCAAGRRRLKEQIWREFEAPGQAMLDSAIIGSSAGEMAEWLKAAVC